MARQTAAGPDERLLTAQAYEAAFFIDGHDGHCRRSKIMRLGSFEAYECPEAAWARPPFFEAQVKRDRSEQALERALEQAAGVPVGRSMRQIRHHYETQLDVTLFTKEPLDEAPSLKTELRETISELIA
jgi:hypothetical protein